MDRAEATVLRIGRGYQLSQALYVAAKLGVADVLSSEPLAAEAVAEAVDVRAPVLRRVLRALVAAGQIGASDRPAHSKQRTAKA